MFARHDFRPAVLSLYCFTAEAVRPWAAAGFDCYCFDIQHPEVGAVEAVPGGGVIHKERLDLWNRDNVMGLARRFAGRAAFLSAFPVCTDMAVSGARHFAGKAAVDPLFQRKAADRAMWCGDLGEALGCPWYAENPVSALSSLWRKPDHVFNPYEFGGYIPGAEALHPRWPDYIPPRDAYTKRTCLWTGGGFVMPERRPVPLPGNYGGSLFWRKLGGKSMKTKNIRSATPRGFARAVVAANARGLLPVPAMGAKA